jgi:hypothetical protein
LPACLVGETILCMILMLGTLAVDEGAEPTAVAGSHR